MKIKLETTRYEFKNREEENNFKSKIQYKLDTKIDKFEPNAGLRSITSYV